MTVAILGAGVMGDTVLSGLVRSGRSPADLVVSERRPERAAELRERYGVDVVNNVQAVTRADTD
jgi:pyrroline-5-carboxylate reductase